MMGKNMTPDEEKEQLKISNIMLLAMVIGGTLAAILIQHGII